MLRFVGIILMLIDHVSYLFFPDFYFGRVLGRFCAPIFFYYLSKGYELTTDINAYLSRLLKWALVSQVIIWIFIGFERLPHLNILFTLCWCLVSLKIFDLITDKFIKTLFFITTCFLSSYFNFEYGWYAVCSVFIFRYSHILELRTHYVLLNVLSIFDAHLGFVQIFAAPSHYLVRKFSRYKFDLKLDGYLIYPLHWLFLCLFLEF